MIFGRVRHMVKKEFIIALRDPKMRAFIFLVPVFQLLLFGYVVTMDVKNIKTAWFDLDKSAQSRELSGRLEASGLFKITHTPSNAAELMNLLDRGEVLCTFQIERGLAENIKMHRTSAIQIMVDGTDSNSATIALSYANRIIAQYSRELSARSRIAPKAVEFLPRIWYNPDLRSKNYNVPAVMASIIMLACLMLTSLAIVREKESGTLEQLMVTPIRPIEIMLGKTIPFAVLGFVDMALVMIVGVFWFGVPIKGSLLLLTACTGVYLISILGIGLFISTIARTQQQALMATSFFYLPAILLSGFIFPIENMPMFFQYLTYLNPLRYFLVIIRGIFLKGTGPDILWPQIAALFAIGAVIITLSAMRFRKRLA